MPLSLKITLKKKPKTDLSHVRCRIEKRGGDCKKLSVEEFPSPVKDYVVSGKAGYNNKDQTHMSRKRKFLEATNLKKGAGNISYNEEDESEVVSGVIDAFKHDNTRRLDSQNGGGWKMDISKIIQCTNVLKTLMNHPSGWVFNQPVDPVALNIPDYFSIISKPMDLGTIKHKLGRKLYPSTDQFAADVRLTFSNAMRYNPPHNYVHMMAKDLNGIFNARWKSAEFTWRKECPNSSQLSVRKTAKKQSVTSVQVLQRASSCNSSSLASKCLTAADKLKLQNSLAKISGRSIPPQLRTYLRKRCLLDPSERRTSVDIDALDDETLWELHEIVRSCGDAESTEPAGLKRKSRVLMKESDQGTGGTLVTSGSVNTGSCTTTLAYKDTSHPCVDTDHPDICHHNFSKASFSDVSERSSYHQNVADHSIASKLEGENISVVLGDDDGCHTFSETGTAIVHVDNRQHTPDSSSPAVAIPLTEAEFPWEEQLSPTRALRAAMLKSRFADTILKAQHRTLLNHGEKGDPTHMQREKEKLEKKQHEEKARIEAQVRAAEAAARLKAEVDLKMQREREREAARLALQKMEKTVDIDEDSQFFKELENLGYSQPVHLDLPDDTLANFMNAVERQSALSNPLAQLGLFIKEDDLDEDIDNGYVEEGEIGSF